MQMDLMVLFFGLGGKRDFRAFVQLVGDVDIAVLLGGREWFRHTQ